MSGPKSSGISIRAEQQRRMTEERRKKLEEEMRIRLVESSIENLLSELLNCKMKVQNFGDTEVSKLKELFTEHHLISALDGKKSEILNSLNSFPEAHYERKFDEMKRYEQQVKLFLEKSYRNIILELTPIVSMMKDEIITKSEKLYLEMFQNVKAETNNINLTLPGSHSDDRKPPKLEGQWRSFQDLIQPYLSSVYLQNKADIEQLFEGTKAIYQNEHLDESYKIIQIDQRRKSFLTTINHFDCEMEVNRNLESEFHSLLIRYQSLCSILGKEFLEEAFSIRDSKQQIYGINQKIALAEKEWRELEEATYISKSVNEVMKNLGFDVIATDLLSTPKQNITQQIYQFGNETAINVSTSDQGSLLFQVVGISYGKKEEVTSHEKLKIIEDMERFCEQYPVIKEELRNRGLNISKENEKPVSEQYVSFLDISKKKNVKAPSTKMSVQNLQQKQIWD